MRRTTVSTLALASVLCGVLAGCGDDPDDAAAATTVAPVASTAAPAAPVVVENCGRTLTFDTTPERVVGLDQISTELLLELGVGDRMIGTANQSDPPFDEIAAAFDALPVLSANYPTAEEFVAADADFVVGNLEFLSYSQDAGFGGAFTRDQLDEQGIGSFALICNGEEDTSDLLLERFTQLAQIFGVTDTATAVVDEVNASLAETAAVLADAEPVPTLIYIDGSGPIQTLGTPLERAGGANILTPDEGGCCPPEIGVEVVVDRAPEAILVSSFGNLDPSGPTLEDKVANLSTLMPTVPAVADERYLAIDFIAFSTPGRLARDTRAIAEFLHPELEFPS